MNCVSGHQYHATRREALNHLSWARKHPGGIGIKHLNVFYCGQCKGFHVGRAWRSKREAKAAQPKPAPAAKALTPGQQRRADKKAAEKTAREKLFADYTDSLRIAKILADRQIALYEALGIKPRTAAALKAP